jgi:hypothetical protein
MLKMDFPGIYKRQRFECGDTNRNDFATNYYEIRVPLKITKWGTTDSLGIWPEDKQSCS